MASTAPSRIFISYARKDGADLAQRLEADLKERGFDPWLDTQRLHAGSVWSVGIESEIDSREVTLALLSPGSYSSEICRAEQLRALDKGNRVIPVLAVKHSDRPIFLYARQYLDFTNTADYSIRLDELIADISGNATATLPSEYRKTRVTYLTAPPRVANYLERPEALHALRDTLFAEDHRQPIALTALAGMGGIGKTVLAKALTDDEVVQRAFPDGIVWITAGKERKRDFIEEMREVAKALGDDLTGYDTALGCENRYRTIIAEKAALIVVDDVWSKSDIEPLLADSPRSRFLFTTRDASIGRFVAAREHRADLLDPQQARELLASWTNLSAENLPPSANEIVEQCGNLPLALSVVGGMLRDAGPKSWQDTLDLLRNAELSAIEDLLPEGQQSFFKAVEVSFQSLKPEMQERYKALAMLIEDMAAPLPILQALWNVDEAQARRISRILADRSLAQRESADESTRLHDLQLDYVRAQWPKDDKEALKLIHSAIRLSSHVIGKDHEQFASQMTGRLLSHQNEPGIGELLERLRANAAAPCLWPLSPSLEQAGSPTRRVLEGHTALVYSVALSADGKRAVSGSGDNTLRLWDLDGQTPPRVLEGHTDEVRAVALSADVKRAVSGSLDNTLRVWDLDGHAPPRVLEGHTGGVTAVALTADCKRAVSGSLDNTLRVWDLDGHTPPRVFEGHTDWVRAVALSADGKRALSGSDDETLRVWDLDGHTPPRVLEGHTGWVRTVALSADGKRAVSGSDDETLRVWDLDGHTPPRVLEGHTGGVTAVALSADGKRAVSGSDDKTLRLWDLDGHTPPRVLEGHAAPVYAVALSADGKRAVSGSHDMTLRVWDLDGQTPPRVLEGHADRVSAVALSADGKRAVSGSYDKTLRVWDLDGHTPPRVLEGHTARVNAVALSADGQRAVSGSHDMTLRVWDLDGLTPPRVLEGGRGGVRAVALSADGKRAISGPGDGTLRLWDLDGQIPPRVLEGHTDLVFAVALSADGRRAVSGSYDKLCVSGI